MQISAALVKELRERTGAGMMECKKALVASGGDIEAAVEAMRKTGLAQADRKAGRIAADGLIAIETTGDGRCAAMVEVNCETDFVAKEEAFGAFVARVARRVLEADPADLDALGALPIEAGGEVTVEIRRRELVARIGENLSVRRFHRMSAGGGHVGWYVHGGRIGVLVGVTGDDGSVGKEIAMHVAASRPTWVAESDIPREELDKERAILVAQARGSGKPPEIVDRMVEGRLRKYINAVTLLGQPFVRDPDISVEEFLSRTGSGVTTFRRFEVGEGIEKRADNFVGEVMAQARGA